MVGGGKGLLYLLQEGGWGGGGVLGGVGWGGGDVYIFSVSALSFTFSFILLCFFHLPFSSVSFISCTSSPCLWEMEHNDSQGLMCHLIERGSTCEIY